MNRLEVNAMNMRPSPMACDEEGRRLEVLTINKYKKDCAALRSIMRHTNWVYHCAHSLEEALQSLKNHYVPVVMSSQELPDGTWKDVIAAVHSFPIPPKVLIYSDRQDTAFLMDVLNAGGYDVILKPLDRDEVLRLITLACLKWKDDAKALKQSLEAIRAAG